MESKNGYVLEQFLEAPYYQPYPEDQLPADGDWGKMPRSNRPQSEIQRLHSRIAIQHQNKECSLQIEITGTDHVPVAIELAFRKGGKLEGVQKVEGIENAFLMDNEKGAYSFQNHTITFGHGKKEHSWTQLRGALPKLDAMSTYITGFTPFFHELKIK